MTIPIGALAFSPDGKYLAVAVGLALDAFKSQPSVKILRVSDLSTLGSYLPNLTPVRQLSWNPTETILAVAGGDATVRLGSPVLHPNGGWTTLSFPKPVLSLGFSPKQAVLAVASGSAVTLWSAAQ